MVMVELRNLRYFEVQMVECKEDETSRK